MNFTAEDVKKLREATGAGFADCRAALTEASSYEAAVKLIEQKGQSRAEKVKGQDRETRQGHIFSYIHHNGTIGVLLELNCTTDFVARSDDFRELGHELAIQIAGLDPQYVSFDQIPAEVLTEARARISDDPSVKKIPAAKRDEAIAGKLRKEFGSQVLLEQAWLKDESRTIGTLVDDVIRKTGENIVIRRFVRFALGE
jgi:elongation factor Ts